MIAYFMKVRFVALKTTGFFLSIYCISFSLFGVWLFGHFLTQQQELLNHKLLLSVILTLLRPSWASSYGV